jgi:hypothetical protein
MSDSESVRGSTVGVSADLDDVQSEVPEGEYARRLEHRKQQLKGIEVLHKRLWSCLLLATLAGLVLGYAALWSHLVSPHWTVLPLLAVLSIVRSLAKNAHQHSRVRRVAAFYRQGLERLRHQWQGRGIGGEEFEPDVHLYASDLDLFGAGSLFELLCTARTGVGRAMLANWLLSPASCDEVTARQAAITELRGMLDLREDWASVGSGALDQAGSSVVRDWAAAPAVEIPFSAKVMAIALPICLATSSVFARIGLWGQNWLWAVVVVIGLQALLAVLLLRKTRLIAADVTLPSFEIALLAPLLDRLVAGTFQSPLLRSLKSALAVSPRPSKRIRRLGLWVWLLGLRQSEYFALPSSLILWGTNLTIFVERWRQQNRDALARWLESVGQFEALLCLARYYYENPGHTFPVLKPHSPLIFHAHALGHPLLDDKMCVRCNLRLDCRDTQLIVVSGSNMSGKSTLLRSIGVNTVLAFAGAPVRAARLELSTILLGCSIDLHDSLLLAKSRFQAEVERLKSLLALAQTHRLLFLIDEVLGGTNSNDRLRGTKAIIERLMTSGAVGLVTTHDLALTEVVRDFNGRAINVHFRDLREDGEMRFDYKMWPGVLTCTNGLKMMSALGLLPEPKE